MNNPKSVFGAEYNDIILWRIIGEEGGQSPTYDPKI